MSSLIYLAIPAFILTLGLEAFFVTRARREGHRGYERRDSLASLAMGLGNVAVAAVAKGGWLLVWTVLYEHRLFDLPRDAAWVWVLLFVAEDLCYYVFHRVSHQSRFFWAAHVSHHSSRHYNLSTALRQTWTEPLTSGIFWAPLALLGFHPAMILVQQAISLLYQYWIHVEWIGKLGPLEWVFNTPSHHRVHHGRNPLYLDRNHGGILIIWDRLFGTFEEEHEAPDYGLTTNLDTFNPITIAFHEWVAIGRDLRAARSLREVLGVVFGPPGWRADGTGATSAVMRARHLEAGAATFVDSPSTPASTANDAGASAIAIGPE